MNYSNTFPIRFTPAQRAELRQFAAQVELPESQVVRLALRHYMRRNPLAPRRAHTKERVHTQPLAIRIEA